jgi:hypothetical protein
MTSDKSLSLYDITGELAGYYSRLQEVGGDLDADVNGQSIGEAIDKHELLHRNKIGSICWIVKSIETDAKICKEQAARLMDRAKAKLDRVHTIKAAMRESMERLGILKVDAPEFTVWRQRNGKPPLVITATDDRIPERFIKTEVVKSIDMEALRAAVEAGDADALAVAEIGETGESLRIR